MDGVLEVNETKTSKTKKIQQAKKSKPHHVVPDQIHKVPDTVRKAIKVGKFRRNSNKIVNPEENQPKFMDENPLERQPLKIDLKVKPLFHLISSKVSDEQEENITDAIAENLKSEAPRIRGNGDRMLYLKKKLSPLRKGVTGQPLSLPTKDKKNFKITFLNIEKVELAKMYEPLNDSKSSFLPIKKNLAMTSSMVTSKNNDFQVENFLQSTSFSSRNQNFRRSFVQSDPKRIEKQKQRLKPFIIPFDRYQYRDFIWKAALSNGYLLESPQKYLQKFKIYIGKGNNSMLIKTIFKRRHHWWSFTDKFQEATFSWSQIKINQIFYYQKNHQPPTNSQNIEIELQKIKDNKSYKLHRKFMHDQDILNCFDYFKKHRRVEDRLEETMGKRNKIFKSLKNFQQLPKNLRIHNHLPNNYVIGNKKALFYTMKKYYQNTKENLFDYLPLTFHIQNGLDDNEYLVFLNHFYDRAKKIRAKQKAIKNGQKYENESDSSTKSTRNMWIVKPGQFTNRGNGINVCMNLEEIKKILKKRERHDNGNLKTYIIQSYLERPFLYQRRKFDIRHFIMISSIQGRIKGYWYQFGYIRTTSFEYSLKNNFTSVHLTNDAVQKYLPEYGKYQKGNKVSYQDFQKYLDKDYRGKYDFFSDILPKLKKISTDAIRACALTIDPERKGTNFEIFGLDFMIDSDFHPWLIEINNNPCLELSCPLLNTIVPDMIQNAMRLCVDSLIPPPAKFNEKRPKFTDKAIENNKFEIVYDSLLHEEYLNKLYNGQYILDLDYKQLQKDLDEVFDDDGVELDEF